MYGREMRLWLRNLRGVEGCRSQHKTKPLQSFKTRTLPKFRFHGQTTAPLSTLAVFCRPTSQCGRLHAYSSSQLVCKNASHLLPSSSMAKRSYALARAAQCQCRAATVSAPQTAQKGENGAEGSAQLKQTGKLQTCDFSILKACATDLKRHFVPSKIDQDTICVLLRNREALENGGSKQWLYLSWHQLQARLSIGSSPERGSSSEAYSLGEQMQSALRKQVLLDVSLPSQWERVVKLEIGPRIGECSFVLYLEIMGNYSNLVMADQAGKILACGRQVSGKMSSRRSLQAGSVYSLPPPQKGSSPSTAEPFSSWHANLLIAAEFSGAAGKSGVASLLVQAYRGVSPSLAALLCHRAHVAAESNVRDLELSQLQDLHSQWVRWVQRLETEDFQAALVTQPSTCISVLEDSRETSQTAKSILEVVDLYYRLPQEEDVFGKLAHRVSTAIQKALKRLQSKRAALTKQLAQVAEAEDVQKQGDLIIANLYRYKRGADSLEVEDWETGKTVKISLDPLGSANEQAEGLFKRARKLRRTSEHVEPLLQGVDDDESDLREIESQVEGLDAADSSDLQALREIEEEMVQRGFCKAPADADLAQSNAKLRKAKKRANSAGSQFRRFDSPSGFQVLVGRNNIQNDELSHKVANDTDLWFHVRGKPGSHTVLRIPSGKSPTDADVQAAADLAAFFSKARQEGKTEVIYTLAKALYKPKGARPGQVLVRNEKAIMAVPSQSAAARLSQVS